MKYQDDPALRPQNLDEYIGQEELKNKLKIAIEAAKTRDDSLPSMCLAAGPGLGKTSLAYILGNEVGANTHIVSGPSLKKISDVAEVLMSIKKKDVLLIDEIHRLPINIEEVLYEVVEDFTLNIKSGGKPLYQTKLNKFSLVGCTTKLGKISAPLRDRFEIVHNFQPYTTDELVEILKNNIKKMSVDIKSEDLLESIAKRSRGTPRIANKFLKRIRDFAQARNDSTIDLECIEETFNMEGVDKNGLGVSDINYLRTIKEKYGGGPVGKNTLAKSLNIDDDTIEESIEPYLAQLGMVSFTSRGRQLTAKGWSYTNKENI